MKVYSKSHRETQTKASIKAFEHHWTTGLNRRNFMKGTVAATLLAGIAGCKPAPIASDNKVNIEQKQSLINQSKAVVDLNDFTFSSKQHIDLQAVYLRLFPDDGDGPSSKDLNILTYLEWAMTDKKNKADGDPEFIIKGLGWLNQYANDDHGQDFAGLSFEIQDQLISSTAQSDAGKNWLNILIYYLVEALTLDPYYGGNTNQTGWNWLEYQSGFPRPSSGKTYRDFT